MASASAVERYNNMHAGPVLAGVPSHGLRYRDPVPSAAQPVLKKARNDDSPHFVTDESVPATIRAIPWKRRGYDAQLRSEQLLWACRKRDPNGANNDVSMLNLNQLNAVLREGWERAVGMLQQAQMQDSIKQYGEHEWTADMQNIISHRQYETIGVLTLRGILDKYNYVGALENIMRQKGVQANRGEQQTLKLLVSLRAFTSCFWNEPRPGCPVGFILKRVKGDGKNAEAWGPFQMVSWIGHKAAYPTMAERFYEDTAGCAQYGHFVYVGKILRVESDGGNPPNPVIWQGDPEASATAVVINRMRLLLDLSRPAGHRNL